MGKVKSKSYPQEKMIAFHTKSKQIYMFEQEEEEEDDEREKRKTANAVG